MYEKGDIFPACKEEEKLQDGPLFLACQAFIRKSHLHVNTVLEFPLFALEGGCVD